MRYTLRSLLTQFTLRDLFWLVLVCALAVGWWREWQRPDARFWKHLAEGCIRVLEREGCEVWHNESSGEYSIAIVVPHALAGDWAKENPGVGVPFPADYQKTLLQSPAPNQPKK